MRFPEHYKKQENFRFRSHEQFVVNLVAPLIREGKSVQIGTHDGKFHADELMAIAILMLLISTLGGKWQIHRLNRDDQNALNGMDILVDIGREFDPSSGRFDHHQAGGAGYRWTENGVDIPFSSCGLVWWCCGLFLSGEDVSVFNLIDEDIVRDIDASDNAVTMPNGYRFKDQHGIQREVNGSPSHISGELGAMNGLPASDPVLGQIYNPEAPKAEQRLAKFHLALQRAYTTLVCHRERAMKTPEARQAIENAMAEMEDGVLVLPKMPWEILFKVPGCQKVRIIVRKVSEGYEIRCLQGLKAPEAWCSLSNGELLETQDLKFCHHSGQILGAETKEAALEAAQKILEHSHKAAA